MRPSGRAPAYQNETLGLLSTNCKKMGWGQGAGEDTPQRLARNHRAELSHGSAFLLLCLSLLLLLLVSEKGSCVAQAGLRLAKQPTVAPAS